MFILNSVIRFLVFALFMVRVVSYVVFPVPDCVIFSHALHFILCLCIYVIDCVSVVFCYVRAFSAMF